MANIWGVNATINNAKRFIQGVINHVISNKGTQFRLETPIETYLFNLLDEDQKTLCMEILKDSGVYLHLMVNLNMRLT